MAKVSCMSCHAQKDAREMGVCSECGGPICRDCQKAFVDHCENCFTNNENIVME